MICFSSSQPLFDPDAAPEQILQEASFISSVPLLRTCVLVSSRALRGASLYEYDFCVHPADNKAAYHAVS